MPVITGAAQYPTDIIPDMKLLGVDVRAFDAQSIAEEAGNVRASNVALIGLASSVLGFDHDILRAAVAACVPAKALEVKMKAFDLAYEYASGARG